MKGKTSAFDWESFKGEQSILVLLNLAVLAGLVLVHVAFISLLGLPSRMLLILVTVRFLLLIGELLWLQNMRSLWRPGPIAMYRHLAIGLSITFAFLVSYVAGRVDVKVLVDSHYSVLMVLPIISAAFHFRLPGALAVTALTVALTFLQVWFFFQRHPPTDLSEYFEAATVCLIFVVVALVVSILVAGLHRGQMKLKENLAELYRTRDRLMAEEKLAAVGRLASGIAHEIRNPVAMISSSLTVAMRQEKDSLIRAEMFEVAAQEAARLEKMTGDFLEYARMKTPVRSAVPLVDTLGYVATLGKAKASQIDSVIRLDVPPDLNALIDDAQMQAALLNLLTNALDAMPTGGLVTLGAYVGEDHELTIYVENSGGKVSDEDARRVFEPFFTTKQRGTGLGLSLVHSTAQAHGGTATLAINEVGCVRFCITLPDAAQTVPANARSTNNGSHSNS